jgi:hypothetical protein
MVGLSICPNIKTQLRLVLSLPRRGIQATLLTRSGPFITIGLAPNFLDVGAALIQELIKRASASKTAPE